MVGSYVIMGRRLEVDHFHFGIIERPLPLPPGASDDVFGTQ